MDNLVVLHYHASNNRVRMHFSGVGDPSRRNKFSERLRTFTDDLEDFEDYPITGIIFFTPKTTLSKILKLVKEVLVDLSIPWKAITTRDFLEAQEAQEMTPKITANLILEEETKNWLLSLWVKNLSVESRLSLYKEIQTVNQHVWTNATNELKIQTSLESRPQLLEIWQVIKNWFQNNPEYALVPEGTLYLLEEISSEHALIFSTGDNLLNVEFVGDLGGKLSKLEEELRIAGVTFYQATSLWKPEKCKYPPLSVRCIKEDKAKIAKWLADWCLAKGIAVQNKLEDD